MKKRTLCVISLLLMVITIGSLIYAQDQSVFGPKDLTVSWLRIHLSFHRFTVDDPGDGIITITKNTPDLKLKGGFVLCNRSMISLREFFSGSDTNLEKEISLRATNRSMIFLRGQQKAAITLEVRKKNPIPPPEVTFSADPSAITLGELSTLTWTTKHADTVSINQGIGAVDLSGSMDVSPTETATYTLTAEGKGGIASKNVTVIVHTPPTVAISADPQTIKVGDPSTLTWSSTNADTCVIEPGVGMVSGNGSTPVSPSETTTYTITATGPGGTATATVTVTVIPPTPTVSISANPEIISIGEATTLSWTSYNAEKAYIDNGIGVVQVTGSTAVFPEHTTTYTITVTGSLGSASAQATAKVTGNPEPQPEGSFGGQYEDLVPQDATVESYDPKRFSLITGEVRTIEDLPVSDVSITIHGHPEYGTTYTDGVGRFSIPMEGGATYTVVYKKDGMLTAQRKVYVPWNDIAIAPTIEMISEDLASTTVTFDGNPDTVVTHKSTEVTDEFGIRSCTMIFSGDNKAYLVDEEGNDIHELSTITTHATEFTTPDSMPAILPPTSAYTYCAELSVDGAQRVRFDKPVIIWVDNFLGFNVGEIVPVGYYDREKGVWVPSDNGVVVKLLDIDTDGIVDSLDADGDDQPDDLNSDGSYGDEVMGLNDPLKYPPDATFWRVKVAHFSPWDCNWPYGLPEGAIAPNPKGLPEANQQKDEQRDCRTNTGSSVEERSGIFHEDISMPGADMTLHYASKRVYGYKTAITIPTSGEVIPDSLKGIIVKLETAGQTFEQTLDPLPDQKAEFVWDGLDHLGRHVAGATTAHVSVGFVYDGVYYAARGDVARSFAQAGDEVTGIQTRQEIIVWNRSKANIYTPNSKIECAIAEGWTISANHYVNGIDPSTLHKGDGSINKNDILIINTMAGTTFGYSGDGSPATEAQLQYPCSVATDASGNLYIADGANDRVRKVDTNGIITTVAGNGIQGYSGDGGPATEAQLNWPIEIDIDASGNLYIIDYFNLRVRKVDTDGTITTVAGNGTEGYSGDGGPATEAQLREPVGIAVDVAGNLYISDRANFCVRKVDTNGIITTVAGNGIQGYSGDGGPATEAQLREPVGIAVDVAGNLYISDRANFCVRKVDTDGTITTVAGNGIQGYSGDGGPATEASFDYPKSLTTDASGNLYITDYRNFRVRLVDTRGVIRTVAGGGYPLDSLGDGGPAMESRLYYPIDLVLDSAGNLYIDEYLRHRIRKVGAPSALAEVTIAGDIPFAEKNGLGHIMFSTGQHKRTIDLDTGVVLYEFGYDEDKQLVSITDQFGNQTLIERDAGGVPTAILSPDGLTTLLEIDADNHLTRITYPDGSYYDFEYTPDGLMTAKIEPEGNRFEHVFNELGRLTDAADEESGQWSYTRTAYENGDLLSEVLTGEGNLTSYLDHTYSTGTYTSAITDPLGGLTLYSQSADGLSVSKSLSCGMGLEFRYDVDSEYKYKYIKEILEGTPLGLAKITQRDKTYLDTNSDDIPDLTTETVSVNGKATILEQDTLQAQKTITSPEGRTVSTLYDPATLLTTSLTIPGLYETTYGYDTRGRLTLISTNTRDTTFAYDAQGFLASIIDPEGYSTTYTYDPVGRMTGINRPDGTSIGFAYDANGNMAVLTNPSTISHAFGYNLVDRNDSYHTPQSGSYSYVYDKDRRLIRIDFPSGNQINNVYDKTRLIQIQTPEGNIDFTYLCGTKVGSVTYGADTITYTYDGKLLTSEALTGTLDQTLAYTYNNDFNLTSLTYAGDTHLYTYDDDGLLTGAGSFAISRNEGNGLPEAVIGDSLTLTRTFNGYGEVEAQGFTVSSQNLTSWNLVRDDNGRIIQKEETVDGTAYTYKYTYDPVGRLLTVTKDDTLVEEYHYGPDGTRTSKFNALRGISERTFTYSDENHLLTAGTATYQYDVDGFLTNKTKDSELTAYDYSSRGELLSVTLPDGKTIEYVHDPLGRRIAKSVNGFIVEKYLWQGLTRLLAVYDGSANLLMRFEYADGRMPVAMTKGATTYYLAYDQVGSLRLVSNTSGGVVKRVEYDSFGNIIDDTNPSFAVPFGFACGLHDRDTGLVHFGFRDYDPDIGRWTAKDPILFLGRDTDLYGYCLNNPVNWVDPWGLYSFRTFLRQTADSAAIAAFISVLTPGGQTTTLVFLGISAGAAGLEIALYSEDPWIDTLKEAIKSIPFPLPKGLYKELLDRIISKLLGRAADEAEDAMKKYREGKTKKNQDPCID